MIAAIKPIVCRVPRHDEIAALARAGVCALHVKPHYAARHSSIERVLAGRIGVPDDRFVYGDFWNDELWVGGYGRLRIRRYDD